MLGAGAWLYLEKLARGGARLYLDLACTSNRMAIPVVDLEGVFSSPDLSSCPQVAQIHSAFSTIGFVFIKNHGIPRKSVSSCDSDKL